MGVELCNVRFKGYVSAWPKGAFPRAVSRNGEEMPRARQSLDPVRRLKFRQLQRIRIGERKEGWKIPYREGCSLLLLPRSPGSGSLFKSLPGAINQT